MTPEKIDEYLKDYETWQDTDLRSLQIRVCFCLEMASRQYGREETRDAWLWYAAGWLACYGEKRLRIIIAVNNKALWNIDAESALTSARFSSGLMKQTLTCHDGDYVDVIFLEEDRD